MKLSELKTLMREEILSESEIKIKMYVVIPFIGYNSTDINTNTVKVFKDFQGF